MESSVNALALGCSLRRRQSALKRHGSSKKLNMMRKIALNFVKYTKRYLKKLHLSQESYKQPFGHRY